MTVVKKYPLKDILFLQERMNRAFEESLGDNARVAGEWIPPVDIYEDDQGITLKIELAGMSKDDIMLDVCNGVLTLSGKKKFRSEFKADSYHMIERQYGNFKRSFTLPERVDSEHIDASYEKGVLVVTLRKHEGEPSRRIAITED